MPQSFTLGDLEENMILRMELPWNLPHGRCVAVFELLHPSALSQEDQLMSVRELDLYVPLRDERRDFVSDFVAGDAVQRSAERVDALDTGAPKSSQQ